MLDRLTEQVLPHIIGVVVHKRESLTLKEREAQETFMKRLQIRKRKTENPLIVAIIGLVGSGKSSIAKEMSTLIGATVINGDEVRVELRKRNERYEGARKIGENAMLDVIKQGSNVILDSDYVDPKKRASIRKKAQKAGAHLVFIRTHCDFDVMVDRILNATYYNSVDDFFGGASTKYEVSEKSKGAIVKIREMWRRTPHHYRWINQGGGKWVLKKFPFSIFAEIDTTDPDGWKLAVQKTAKKILSL